MGDGGYTDDAPRFVAQGVAREAIVFPPQVVDLIVELGGSPQCAVTDALVLMRVWKWNWIQDQAGRLHRSAPDAPALPWRSLTYDDLAAQTRLGSRNRVRDAVGRLEGIGLLSTVVDTEAERGSRKWYLVTWPGSVAQGGCRDSAGGGAEIRQGGCLDSAPPYTVDKKKLGADVQALGSGSSLSLAAAWDDDPHTTRLCRILADAVEAHRGTRPKVSARWIKDLGLLLRRGPLGLDQPSATAPEAVEAMIAAVFGQLAEPDRKGFCWADQVRSPHALREHWDQLALALRRRSPARGAEPATVDQVDAVRRFMEGGA